MLLHKRALTLKLGDSGCCKDAALGIARVEVTNVDLELQVSAREKQHASNELLRGHFQTGGLAKEIHESGRSSSRLGVMCQKAMATQQRSRTSRLVAGHEQRLIGSCGFRNVKRSETRYYASLTGTS